MVHSVDVGDLWPGVVTAVSNGVIHLENYCKAKVRGFRGFKED